MRTIKLDDSGESFQRAMDEIAEAVKMKQKVVFDTSAVTEVDKAMLRAVLKREHSLEKRKSS